MPPAVSAAVSPGRYPELMAPIALLRRGPTLEELADTAVFVASDRGSGITASIVNVSSGVSAH